VGEPEGAYRLTQFVDFTSLNKWAVVRYIPSGTNINRLGSMKKLIFSVLFVLLLYSLSSHAATFEMNIDRIHSVKCAQKIHDYFEKNYGRRVQNLKIDVENSKISFESISMDSIELENLKNGLNNLKYKVVNSTKDAPPKNTGSFSEETIPSQDLLPDASAAPITK
jgi:hypothetical protein